MATRIAVGMVPVGHYALVLFVLLYFCSVTAVLCSYPFIHVH